MDGSSQGADLSGYNETRHAHFRAIITGNKKLYIKGSDISYTTGPFGKHGKASTFVSTTKAYTYVYFHKKSFKKLKDFTISFWVKLAGPQIRRDKLATMYVVDKTNIFIMLSNRSNNNLEICAEIYQKKTILLLKCAPLTNKRKSLRNWMHVSIVGKNSKLLINTASFAQVQIPIPNKKIWGLDFAKSRSGTIAISCLSIFDRVLPQEDIQAAKLACKTSSHYSRRLKPTKLGKLF
jgi:hypothetical protein